MNKLLPSLQILVLFLCLGCNNPGLAETYKTFVPYTGNDPRFVGQEYTWELHLNGDGTFL